MGLFDFLKGKKDADRPEEPKKEEASAGLVDEEDDITIEPMEGGEDEKYQTVDQILSPKQTIRVEFDITGYGHLNMGEDEEQAEEDITEAVINTDGEASGNPAAKDEAADDEKEPESVSGKKPGGFFAKLKEGLGKTRRNIMGSVDDILGAFTSVDEDLMEELEEALIGADLGAQTSMDIIERLTKRVKRERVSNPADVKDILADEISSILKSGAQENDEVKTPAVILVIGVNGVGKTTTIGKLASIYKAQGKKVLLAAADTFRAAAIDQLKVWGERTGIDVISHEENSDPAAVVFDAVNAAKNRGVDILICDTAGRLHNKKNLMEELKKIAKVIEREHPEAAREVFLVLDATTGQNAMQQAKLFSESAGITGIILTKLDGTAKGGIIVAIKNELNIPVRYVGVGEGVEDLQEFNADEFSKALFG